MGKRRNFKNDFREMNRILLLFPKTSLWSFNLKKTLMSEGGEYGKFDCFKN